MQRWENCEADAERKGFLHPLIQLMYGMEWAQPAIVAEGLAQASVHSASLHEALFAAERLANEAAGTPMPSIVSLLEAVAADTKLAKSARLSDGNKVRDGVLARAKDEMLAIAAKVKVRPEELGERTAEMFDAAVYAGTAAAVHPPKHVKFDFFLMYALPYSITSSQRASFALRIKAYDVLGTTSTQLPSSLPSTPSPGYPRPRRCACWNSRSGST
jgi:questin oxidase-like protein